MLNNNIYVFFFAQNIWRIEIYVLSLQAKTKQNNKFNTLEL